MDRTALPPGARFGEMEIIRVLAVGGFGIVYLARDHLLDRHVAVKEFMPAQLAGRGDGQHVSVRSASNAETYALGLQSFIDEAKLLARISHPAIVKVYRFWEANGTGYMVMQYLHGPTLGDVRRSMSQPPTEAWLRSVIDPLLDALAMLNSEGFYHRDIAPDNVLVSGAGLPVLLDFGEARRVIGDRTQSLTAILKPRYAPIEQYAEAKQLRQGPWTDLYALGALVTYLLDGVPPPAATARSIHDEMEALAQRHIAGVSTGFLSAIDWALAVRPRDRPQNVAELRAALDFPTTVRLAKSGPHALLARQPQPPRPQFARRRWRFAAAGGLALTAMAWGLVRPHLDDVAIVPSTLASAPAAALSADAEVDAKVVPAIAERVEAAAASPALPALAEPSLGRLALAAAQAVPVPLRPARAWRPSMVPDAVAKAKQSGASTNGQDSKLAAFRARTPRPIEFCAKRNFFMRPWCIQRRCDEPRFRANAQCVQPRSVSRYARY